jgi:hypothetical protein
MSDDDPTPTLNEISDAVVASPHWEWTQGMRTTDYLLVLSPCGHDGFLRFVNDGPPGERFEIIRPIMGKCAASSKRPDIDHAGTQGEMLAVVRKAWGCDEWRRLTIEVAGAGWCVIVRNGRHRPPSRARPGWDLDPFAHPRYRGEVGPFGTNEFATEGLALAAALLAAPKQVSA